MSTESESFWVHFLGAVTMLVSPYGPGRVFTYGEELLVTPAIRELNLDRAGRWRFIDELLDDDEAQVLSYGEVIVRRGRWPDGLGRLLPGSFEWQDARDAARAAAHALPDRQAQKAALSDVEARFGTPLTTSRTIADYR